MTADTFAATLQDLRDDEGLSLTLYADTEGVPTIGYGVNLQIGISRAEAEMLLEHRAAERLGELSTRLPLFGRLDPVRQRVLLNMAYQAGVGGLLGFKRMLAALERGDYETAAREALDSKMARQSPKRAARHAAALRTGMMEGL